MWTFLTLGNILKVSQKGKHEVQKLPSGRSNTIKKQIKLASTGVTSLWRRWNLGEENYAERTQSMLMKLGIWTLDHRECFKSIY